MFNVLICRYQWLAAIRTSCCNQSVWRVMDVRGQPAVFHQPTDDQSPAGCLKEATWLNRKWPNLRQNLHLLCSTLLFSTRLKYWNMDSYQEAHQNTTQPLFLSNLSTFKHPTGFICGTSNRFNSVWIEFCFSSQLHIASHSFSNFVAGNMLIQNPTIFFHDFLVSHGLPIFQVLPSRWFWPNVGASFHSWERSISEERSTPMTATLELVELADRPLPQPRSTWRKDENWWPETWKTH